MILDATCEEGPERRSIEPESHGTGCGAQHIEHLLKSDPVLAARDTTREMLLDLTTFVGSEVFSWTALGLFIAVIACQEW
jgi:hypothetical protein